MTVTLKIVYCSAVLLLILLASVSDIKKRKVSNIIPVLMAIAGISVMIFELVSRGGVMPLIYSLSGAFLGFAFTVVPAVRGSMGGADVKMASAAGIGFGPVGILLFMLVSFICASIFMLSKGIVDKIRKGIKFDLKAKAPLVPFMLGGTIAFILYRFL